MCSCGPSIRHAPLSPAPPAQQRQLFCDEAEVASERFILALQGCTGRACWRLRSNWLSWPHSWKALPYLHLWPSYRCPLLTCHINALQKSYTSVLAVPC